MVDHYATRRGEKNALAKLTEEQVREIRKRRANLRYRCPSPNDADSIIAIGKEYGVSPTTISHIVRGKTWRHV